MKAPPPPAFCFNYFRSAEERSIILKVRPLELSPLPLPPSRTLTPTFCLNDSRSAAHAMYSGLLVLTRRAPAPPPPPPPPAVEAEAHVTRG